MGNCKSYNKRLRCIKNKPRYLKMKVLKWLKFSLEVILQKIRIGSKNNINLEDTISI